MHNKLYSHISNPKKLNVSFSTNKKPKLPTKIFCIDLLATHWVAMKKKGSSNVASLKHQFSDKGVSQCQRSDLSLCGKSCMLTPKISNLMKWITE